MNGKTRSKGGGESVAPEAASTPASSFSAPPPATTFLAGVYASLMRIILATMVGVALLTVVLDVASAINALLWFGAFTPVGMAIDLDMLKATNSRLRAA